MKRIALYARVSTKQHGQDPETQLVALRQFASHKGYIVCEEYVDHGWSGAKERRPALDRLLADTPNKKFDVVLVWRFDRFARSVKQLIFALGLFRELGIARSTVRAKHAEVAAEKARAAGGESLISAAG